MRDGVTVTPNKQGRSVMKIDVRFRGLESSDALRDHIARRIHFHLSRFGSKVTAVLVRISDVNGPKGGVDKRCQVTVRGPRLGLATLDEMSGDAYAAVDIAVERIGRSIGRELDRARSDRRNADPLMKAS
jgi:putative sigma-54 modulation protein